MGYGGQEDITGYKYLNFRPRGDSSTVRNSYYIDPDTGKTSSASYASDVFDPRLQSWYGAAKTAISGAFSSIYTLDDGRLAISFNMPVYEGIRSLRNFINNMFLTWSTTLRRLNLY